jgi:hypothetical protein
MAAARALTRPHPNLAGESITLGVRRDQFVGGWEAPLAARRDVVIADSVLEAAGSSGDAEWSFGIEAEVTQVSRFTDMAGEKSTIDHRGTADTGSEGQQDHVGGATCRPLPHFAQQGRARVIEKQGPPVGPKNPTSRSLPSLGIGPA